MISELPFVVGVMGDFSGDPTSPLRPLGDRKAYLAALARWSSWLERSFNAGEARHGAITWLVAVLPLLLLAVAVYYLLLALTPLLAARFMRATLSSLRWESAMMVPINTNKIASLGSIF